MNSNRPSLIALLFLLVGASGIHAAQNARQTFLNLPLRFEENNGTSDARVKYLARGPGYTLFITSNETVLSVRKTEAQDSTVSDGKNRSIASPKTHADFVRVRVEGSNRAATFRGETRLATSTSYFIGNDPTKWHTAATYEQVRCESVYPGIDLLYHGKQQELEYDFELAPGADPKQITLQYEGVRRLRVDKDGSLVLKLNSSGELRQRRPVAYQIVNSQRREVASRYVVKAQRRVVFELGDYDASAPLVIDPPVLSYSTYLGGNGSDSATGIAVDTNGFAYIVGNTGSTDFPTVGQYQGDQTGTDVFIAKFNPSMSGAASLLYCTYLGGSDVENGNAIAVDASGNAFVTGVTASTDFPVLNQYQGDQGLMDVFVAKLNTNTTGVASLVYSTYIGGSSDEVATGISVGGGGNVVVTGWTDSADFPTLNQYQTNQGSTDVFVAKLNPNTSGAASLLYSTYLGGDGADFGNAIAVDGNGVAYVTGSTSSTNFPTFHQYQTDQGNSDVFVAKINPSLSGAGSLLYSTYLGGSDVEDSNSIAVDGNGYVYITGQTSSTNFPLLHQYQGDQPGLDAFVAKFNPNLTGVPSLLYSTYLGGSGADYGFGIAIDFDEKVLVAGLTTSTDFPLVNSTQGNQPGDDAFYAKIDTRTSGTAGLLISSYLGGDGSEYATAVAVRSGDIYLAGQTNSTNFPKLNQYQAHQIGTDCFFTKLLVFDLLGAASRKIHNGTPFDINLPLAGDPAVECRRDDAGFTFVFTFNSDVASGNASVTGGIGNVSGTPMFSRKTMTVNLAGVADAQKITVTLTNVMSASGIALPITSVSANILLGDTTGNKAVNASDVAQTKARSGAVLDTTNFRSDTNVNGTINASDAAQVKANSGHALP